MGRLSSFIRLSVGFVVLAVISIITLIILPFLMPFRIARIKVCNVYGKVAGRAIVALAGVTPNVSNKEGLNGTMPAIYVMNHQSSLDAFLGVWLCPVGACGVFKKEIVRIPFYGWIAYLSGHLLIDRGNKGKAVEALRDIAVLMKKHGLGIWIMPEGTRSRDGALLPFKKGFVHLAVATGLPVVPVVIHGAHRNWEAKTFQFHPMVLDVDVLPPISTLGWAEENAAQHADFVRGIFLKQMSAHDPSGSAKNTATVPALEQNAAG